MAMLHKLSLLDELRRGGYEASLITTFNAYLPFYEEVVLRRLVNAGVRHNVLMMDAQQYAVSIHHHPPRLAGRRYTLLPVGVSGAFHPKLILLVGKKKALVAIGSHNVTLGGFGFNRELTNVVRIEGTGDASGLAVASQVWRTVEDWIEFCSSQLPSHMIEMVRRIREFGPWIDEAVSVLPGHARVLAGGGDTESLWNQLRGQLKGRATSVLITGAFFDNELSFLRRVQKDLEPERMVVGIDPETVQIPRSANDLHGIEFVRADMLGTETDSEGKTICYLHAKCIYIQSDQGERIFVSGSANPSAPAWLATRTSGNIELMLARLGQDATLAAEKTGFTSVFEMPPLEPDDWATIDANRTADETKGASESATGVAVVEDDHVLFSKKLVVTMTSPEFVLLDADRREISRTRTFKTEHEYCVLTIAVKDLASAVGLQCIVNGEVKVDLLLHHARILEEQARTGVQRRFREALFSLHTDTPNIDLLIECIDKIVFADEITVGSAVRKHLAGEIAANVEPQDEGSMSIDISEVRTRKAKRRLKHSSDFSYLLNVLIYHLRVQEDRSVEELDRFGRNEEEQIGADDDEDSETTRRVGEYQDEMLRLCHSKIRTVINRMTAQFRAFFVGKQSLEQVLVRLLGVLAVLRELRACDRRVTWVEKGKTTVPRELRVKLFEEVMQTLFEGKDSLLHLEELDDFEHSDDMARLKGLVVWLAWDCGLVFDLKKPFMETREQLEARLMRNAMILALAQSIRLDEVVIDEARQSIGSLTAGELDWLSSLKSLAADCIIMKKGVVELQPAKLAQPGDIAVHKSLQNWDLRVVASSDSQYVSLVQLRRDKDRVSYMPGHLGVVRLTSV